MSPPVQWLRSALWSALALLAVAALCVPRSGAAMTRDSVLDSEPRLLASVDVSALEEPFDDFLARLGRQAGVRLRAGGAAADERVTCFVHSRPLRELLGILAEHFDFAWTRETKRGATSFILVQTPAARLR